MLATPFTEDLVGPGNTQTTSDGGFQVRGARSGGAAMAAP